MLALRQIIRRFFLESFFIVLLAWPFIIFLSPFPRYGDLDLLYGPTMVGVIETINRATEIVYAPIRKVLLLGFPRAEGFGLFFAIILGTTVHVIFVNMLGLAVMYIVRRAFSWKLPIATLLLIIASFFATSLAGSQSSAIFDKKQAIDQELGSKIVLSVQDCSIQPPDQHGDTVIICTIAASNLPPESTLDVLTKPVFEMSYSHSGIQAPGAGDPSYSIVKSRDVVLSADRTQAKFESVLTIKDPKLEPGSFYIFGFQYIVDFDRYQQWDLHIPLNAHPARRS